MKEKEKDKPKELLQINRYKLKDLNTAESEIMKYNIRTGGGYISQDTTVFLFAPLYKNVTLNVGFPKDLSVWNDFDHVIVLDEDFGQPYTPFYKYLDNAESTPVRYEPKMPFTITLNVSPFLQRVIRAYNETMDKYSFLEKI